MIRRLKFFDYLYLARAKGMTDREAVDKASAIRGLFVLLWNLRIRVKLNISIHMLVPGGEWEL